MPKFKTRDIFSFEYSQYVELSFFKEIQKVYNQVKKTKKFSNNSEVNWKNFINHEKIKQKITILKGKVVIFCLIVLFILSIYNQFQLLFYGFDIGL